MGRRSAQLAISYSAVREDRATPNDTEAAVRALASEITSNRDRTTPAFLQYVLNRICLLTQADGVAIAVRDQQGVICRASMGNAPDVGSRIQPDSKLTRECFESGKVVICEDVDRDCRIDRLIARSLRLRSVVVVPLRTRDSVIGILEVFSSRALAFDETHVAGLQHVADGLTPVLAEALSGEPPEGVCLQVPNSPEEPESKARSYL